MVSAIAAIAFGLDFLPQPMSLTHGKVITSLQNT